MNTQQRNIASLAQRSLFAAVVISAFASIVFLVLQPLFESTAVHSFYDDFYYYLLPAQRYLEVGRFEFFEGMTTNGFHPGWMAIVIAALKITGGDIDAFFIVMRCLIGVCLILTAYQAYMLVREHARDRYLAIVTAGFVLYFQLVIAANGMEVVLAVPLLIMLSRLVLRGSLKTFSSKKIFLVGMLAGVTLIVRLDTIALVLPLALGLLVIDRPSLRQSIYAVLGVIPFLIYFPVNFALTGMWMPVSGAAKHLSQGFAGVGEFSKVLTTNFPINFPAVICINLLCMLAMLFAVKGGVKSREKILLRLIVASVLIFYVLHWFLSDWPMWFWYLYPFNLTVIATVVCIFPRAEALLKVVMSFLLLGVLFLALVLHQKGTYVKPEKSWFYSMAMEIKAFKQENPGVYAMGDCAGTPAYVMGGGVIQLEGLMGDKEFLQHIEKHTPLTDLFRKYKVDYYVTYNAPTRDGCYIFQEPLLAGNRSPVMKGKSCSEPLFRHVFGGREFMVFDAKSVK